MQSAPANFYLDTQSLAGLRQRAGEDPAASLREVAGQFEALFVQMMLQSMRQASPGGGLFASEQGDHYRDMLDRQLAQQLSGDFGLAELLVRQLGDAAATAGAAPPTTAPLPAAPRPAPAPRTAVEPGAAGAAAPARWDSPEAFVAAVYPHLQRAADRLGADPRALLAQAALETGWGARVPLRADGSSSHNLFGIKADRRWDGERVLVDTLEFEGGDFAPRRLAFRAYPSLAAAARDYADFLSANPRYEAALEQAAEPLAYARELQRAGYATDPDYAAKIERVLQGETLRGGLRALKSAAAAPIPVTS